MFRINKTNLLQVLCLLPAIATSALASECRVTKAQYDALSDGMTYSEAVRVLGCEGEEMSSSSLGNIKTVMLMWEGRGLGANMNAMFQNDRLVTKAQFGLK